MKKITSIITAIIFLMICMICFASLRKTFDFTIATSSTGEQEISVTDQGFLGAIHCHYDVVETQNLVIFWLDHQPDQTITNIIMQEIVSNQTDLTIMYPGTKWIGIGDTLIVTNPSSANILYTSIDIID